jgi:hypothetical protein
MFGREKPQWEREEEKFVHRHFGPVVPIEAVAFRRRRRSTLDA